MPDSDFPPLIRSLCNPALHGQPQPAVRVVETHISWVLLTGRYAYKIKKPVNLGFLDFSTLESRRRYCLEEVRLNRRLARDLYLEVVAITGNPASPLLDGDGPVLEYAVKLKRFDEDCLAERLISENKLTSEHIDALADALANFHAGAARSSESDVHGRPETILSAAEHNFDHLFRLCPRFEPHNLGEPAQGPAANASSPLNGDHAFLSGLFSWTRSEFERHRQAFIERKRDGFVRECHGDLHCGNLVLIENRLVPFDCIEFSEELRWIDCLSEVAFIVMDLEARGRGDLAWRLLNRYLEVTGDYAGMAVFNYYLVYRAMVRAMVNALCLEHTIEKTERLRLEHSCRRYLDDARGHAFPKSPVLLITHGFSGSGKSSFAARLCESLPAVRVASDIERKRLAGIAPLQASASALGDNIYSRAFTARTYGRLLDLGERLLKAGVNTILDATFLKLEYRRACRELAERLGAKFFILDFRTPEAVLRERIAQRLLRRIDPSEADENVLASQIACAEPIAPDEQPFVLVLDSSSDLELKPVLGALLK